MSKGMSKGTAIIQRLLEERRQYEAWIARLNSSADATPGNVRARVREDYEARLVAVMEELKAHAESARLAIQEKAAHAWGAPEEEALAAEKLTEPSCVIRSASTTSRSGTKCTRTSSPSSSRPRGPAGGRGGHPEARGARRAGP